MQNTIEIESGDNTTTSTSSHPELQHAPVNRVTMKPPPFHRTNPTVWFRQMESQFVLAGITNDTTKFNHILAAIPEDVAINLPMEIEDYSSLKDSIIQLYQKSKTELIGEALGTISLDGQKPSVCFLRIQRKLSECHLTMDNDVIKHRLMQAMPMSTRSSLSAHLDLPPDKFAKLADTIYSYSKDTFQENTHVYATQQSSSSSYARQPQPKQRNSSTDNSFQPFSPGQRPKICRFYLFFANSAKRCKPWCKWAHQSPHTSNRHLAHNHPPHRETNSPTRVRGNDWGSYLHPPCRPNQLTEDYFHSRHWIYGINHQINARQHRLRHADNSESQNSKRRPYQSSRKNDAHNRHTLPPTQLQFHVQHRRHQRQHSRTGFPQIQRQISTAAT